jgi:hypothetical protein
VLYVSSFNTTAAILPTNIFSGKGPKTLSILHVNQIAGALHRMFDGVVVLDDAQQDAADSERLFLSRALAAFALTQLAGICAIDNANISTDKNPRLFSLAADTLGFYILAIALACASSEVSYSTLAKREISRLWEDPKKAPYKALFNPGLQANKLWRGVQVLRLIDRALALQRGKLSGRDKGLVVHGNRFIAHIAFQRFPHDLLDPSKQLSQDAAKIAADVVATAIPDLQAKANALYPLTYPATLFKNQQKLAKLAKEMLAKAGRDRS